MRAIEGGGWIGNARHGIRSADEQSHHLGAFRNLLEHQAIFVLVLLAIVAVGWNLLRAVQLRSLRRRRSGRAISARPEPAARRLLRDLVRAHLDLRRHPPGPSLDAARDDDSGDPAERGRRPLCGYITSSMPGGRSGATIRSLRRPQPCGSRSGSASGCSLPPGQLVTTRRVVEAAWGLVVWVFGESFGGIFAPGLSWAFGAPGAVVFYSLPACSLPCPTGLGQSTARTGDPRPHWGPSLLGMALLQAWPGRGFWQGQLHRSSTPGTLTSMLQQMAQTPQPRLCPVGVELSLPLTLPTAGPSTSSS